MRVSGVAIRNFRRLENVQIDIEESASVFVGPNNSGKTSATAIFRCFLGGRDFKVHDFSVARMADFDAFVATGDAGRLPKISLDLWFTIDPESIAFGRVFTLLPKLSDFTRVGIRLSYEIEDAKKLRKQYEDAYPAQEDGTHAKALSQYLSLDGNLGRHYAVCYSSLDEKSQIGAPPQIVTSKLEPDEGKRLMKHLIRVEFVDAQRNINDDDSSRSNRLSSAFAAFYRKNLEQVRFPYIFVDEAQDTFEGIVAGLNLVCKGTGLPLIGYFGDPWQQIYDRSAGNFEPPEGGEVITKTENFRCSKSVIRLLNAYRGDVEQYAAGENKGCEGSVEFLLVRAEEPTEPRKRYSEEQIERALSRMDAAVADWGWIGRDDVVKLFLARQMIARRLGFADLNRLFTGDYASTRAQDAFEVGEHFLLKPFLSTICPLITAQEEGDGRKIINLLRRDSPAFAVDGLNAGKSLKLMIEASNALVVQLRAMWASETLGSILRFCIDKQIIQPSEKLCGHLDRAPRVEAFDEDVHGLDKGDWLADSLFQMMSSSVARYADYVDNNTAYSTQHGVKGEEYEKVMVVYDDIEAAWNQYSFSKVLTPLTAGEPTERQRSVTQKLAYVSFSRAKEDLRVLMFIPAPEEARAELINSKLLEPHQIRIAA